MNTTTTSRLAAHLRLPRGTDNQFAALDGYRAVAATMVVIYHVAGTQWMTFSPDFGSRFLNGFGNFGVTVFFLLSGFLLFRPFVSAILRAQPLPSGRRYFVNRLTRIYPAYWLAITVAMLISEQARENSNHVALNVGELLRLYTLWPVHDPMIGFSGVTVAWTLRIELMFYVALPLIAWALRALTKARPDERSRLRVVLTALALCYGGAVVFRVAVVSGRLGLTDTVNYWLLNFMDWFALGMLLATCVVWRDLGHRLPGWLESLASSTLLCWLYGGALYVIYIYNNPDNAVSESSTQMYWRFALGGAAAFVLLLPATVGRNRRDPLHRALASPPCLFLGTVSYGLYLWHTIVKARAVETSWWTGSMGGRGFWALFAVTFLGGVIAAALSWYLLEQPILRHKDAIFGRLVGSGRARLAGPGRNVAPKGAPARADGGRTQPDEPEAAPRSTPPTGAEPDPIDLRAPEPVSAGVAPAAATSSATSSPISSPTASNARPAPTAPAPRSPSAPPAGPGWRQPKRAPGTDS